MEMRQLLFDEIDLPPIERVPSAGLSRAQRLIEYDRINPHIYDAFERMALEDWRNGFRHLFAMGYIYNIRKLGLRAVKDGQGYQIPNDMATFCTRKLVARYPRFEAAFDTRESDLDGELEAHLKGMNREN